MENRINMVLTLVDDNRYIVINQAIYKQESYLLLAKIGPNDEVTDDVVIVKEGKDTFGNERIDEVTDSNLLSMLAKYLTPLE